MCIQSTSLNPVETLSTMGANYVDHPLSDSDRLSEVDCTLGVVCYDIVQDVRAQG